VSTVSTAANPAATTPALAAFFAAPLTFERVIEGERLLVFAARFGLLLPRLDALATARFDDDFNDFALRFFAVFIASSEGFSGPSLSTITGAFFACLHVDAQATHQEKRLFVVRPRASASSTARPF
jgi:hypothetical protein